MRRTSGAVCMLLWIAAACAQTSAKRPGGAGNAQAAKATAPAAEDWPVWGGKNRDFIVNTSGLADSWPASGPKKLWTRPLGDGYSAIAEEHGVLYTAFGRRLSDVITAIDAATGKTLWEYDYLNPFTNDFSEKVGPGPYTMPQVIGDRVVTASATGKIHSLNKTTGKPVWSHDLYSEFHGTHLVYGYSSHALPYKDTLIFTAGGSGDGKIILADEDGTLALCRATPEKFEVLSQVSVLQNIAWTPPTLVGTHLYLRDRKTIMALDLSR
jgi:outer membrane protein assembly factor BamB